MASMKMLVLLHCFCSPDSAEALMLPSAIRLHHELLTVACRPYDLHTTTTTTAASRWSHRLRVHVSFSNGLRFDLLKPSKEVICIDAAQKVDLRYDVCDMATRHLLAIHSSATTTAISKTAVPTETKVARNHPSQSENICAASRELAGRKAKEEDWTLKVSISDGASPTGGCRASLRMEGPLSLLWILATDTIFSRKPTELLRSPSSSVAGGGTAGSVEGELGTQAKLKVRGGESPAAQVRKVLEILSAASFSSQFSRQAATTRGYPPKAAADQQLSSWFGRYAVAQFRIVVPPLSVHLSAFSELPPLTIPKLAIALTANNKRGVPPIWHGWILGLHSVSEFSSLLKSIDDSVERRIGTVDRHWSAREGVYPFEDVEDSVESNPIALQQLGVLTAFLERVGHCNGYIARYEEGGGEIGEVSASQLIQANMQRNREVMNELFISIHNLKDSPARRRMAGWKALCLTAWSGTTEIVQRLARMLTTESDNDCDETAIDEEGSVLRGGNDVDKIEGDRGIAVACWLLQAASFAMRGAVVNRVEDCRVAAEDLINVAEEQILICDRDNLVDRKAESLGNWRSAGSDCLLEAVKAAKALEANGEARAGIVAFVRRLCDLLKLVESKEDEFIFEVPPDGKGRAFSFVKDALHLAVSSGQVEISSFLLQLVVGRGELADVHPEALLLRALAAGDFGVASPVACFGGKSKNGSLFAVEEPNRQNDNDESECEVSEELEQETAPNRFYLLAVAESVLLGLCVLSGQKQRQHAVRERVSGMLADVLDAAGGSKHSPDVTEAEPSEGRGGSISSRGSPRGCLSSGRQSSTARDTSVGGYATVVGGMLASERPALVLEADGDEVSVQSDDFDEDDLCEVERVSASHSPPRGLASKLKGGVDKKSEVDAIAMQEWESVETLRAVVAVTIEETAGGRNNSLQQLGLMDSAIHRTAAGLQRRQVFARSSRREASEQRIGSEADTAAFDSLVTPRAARDEGRNIAPTADGSDTGGGSREYPDLVDSLTEWRMLLPLAEEAALALRHASCSCSSPVGAAAAAESLPSAESAVNQEGRGTLKLNLSKLHGDSTFSVDPRSLPTPRPAHDVAAAAVRQLEDEGKHRGRLSSNQRLLEAVAAVGAEIPGCVTVAEEGGVVVFPLGLATRLNRSVLQSVSLTDYETVGQHHRKDHPIDVPNSTGAGPVANASSFLASIRDLGLPLDAELHRVVSGMHEANRAFFGGTLSRLVQPSREFPLLPSSEGPFADHIVDRLAGAYGCFFGNLCRGPCGGSQANCPEASLIIFRPMGTKVAFGGGVEREARGMRIREDLAGCAHAVAIDSVSLDDVIVAADDDDSDDSDDKEENITRAPRLLPRSCRVYDLCGELYDATSRFILLRALSIISKGAGGKADIGVIVAEGKSWSSKDAAKKTVAAIQRDGTWSIAEARAVDAMSMMFAVSDVAQKWLNARKNAGNGETPRRRRLCSACNGGTTRKHFERRSRRKREELRQKSGASSNRLLELVDCLGGVVCAFALVESAMMVLWMQNGRPLKRLWSRAAIEGVAGSAVTWCTGGAMPGGGALTEKLIELLEKCQVVQSIDDRQNYFLLGVVKQ